MVVLDILLPDINGRDVMARIRKTNPAVRVLLISGYVDQEIENLVLDGRTDFIRKPFSVTEIGLKISSMLNSAFI